MERSSSLPFSKSPLSTTHLCTPNGATTNERTNERTLSAYRIGKLCETPGTSKAITTAFHDDKHSSSTKKLRLIAGSTLPHDVDDDVHDDDDTTTLGTS
jgi:hypothetical protein